MSVPIHQIALGRTVPPLNRECLESWRALAVYGFEVTTWTDRRATRFMNGCAVPAITGLYRRARNVGEASDILRLALVHRYGGWYVDWDVLLVDPVRFLAMVPDMAATACVLIRDSLTTDPTYACVYDNSLFFMRRGHRLVLEFLSEVERGYSKRPVPNTPFLTGPLALTAFLHAHPEHRNGCHLIEMLDVYALDYEGVMARAKDQAARASVRGCWTPGGAPAIHFWTHAWAPQHAWPARAMKKIVNRVLNRTDGT